MRDAVDKSTIAEHLLSRKPPVPNLIRLPIQIGPRTISTYATLAGLHLATWARFKDVLPDEILFSTEAIALGQLGKVKLPACNLDDLEFIAESLVCDLPQIPDSHVTDFYPPVAAVAILQRKIRFACFQMQGWPAIKLLTYGITRFNPRFSSYGITLLNLILPEQSEESQSSQNEIPSATYNTPPEKSSLVAKEIHTPLFVPAEPELGYLWLSDLKLVSYLLTLHDYKITCFSNPKLPSLYSKWNVFNQEKLQRKLIQDIQLAFDNFPDLDLPILAVTIAHYISLQFRLTDSSFECRDAYERLKSSLMLMRINFCYL